MTTTICIDHLYKAQFGEDRVLWQVFGGRANGFFIEVGAYADLILVEGNPLKDVKVLADYKNNIKLVMKNGDIYQNRL